VTPPRTAAAASESGALPKNVPRLALSVQEACEALGVGWDFWRATIEHEVRIVRRGRRKLVPVAELEAWLDRNAEAPLAATGKGAPTGQETPANGGVRARRAPGRRAP